MKEYSLLIYQQPRDYHEQPSKDIPVEFIDINTVVTALECVPDRI